jgi:hypothetical protein
MHYFAPVVSYCTPIFPRDEFYGNVNLRLWGHYLANTGQLFSYNYEV